MTWISLLLFVTNVAGALSCFAFGGLGCGLGDLLGGGCGGCRASSCSSYTYSYAPRPYCGGYSNYGYSEAGGCCGGRGYSGYGSYGYYEGYSYSGGGGGCCGGSCRRRQRHLRVAAAQTLRLSSSASSASRLRQLAAKSKITPDGLFAECCDSFNLTAGCKQYCNYRSYSVNTLPNVLVNPTASCRLESLSTLHFCASGNRDHRRCCKTARVTETLAGVKCLLFCQPMTNRTVNLDFSYLPCLEKADAIRQCFYAGASEFTRHLGDWNRPTNGF